MRSPFRKAVEKEPVAVKTPLQELLTAENAVQLAQGEIDKVNKEFWDWQSYYGVKIDDDGQFGSISNQSLLTQEVTLLSLQQRYQEFQVRKNVLLRQFHEKLAAWAEVKQRYPNVTVEPVPMSLAAPPA